MPSLRYKPDLMDGERAAALISALETLLSTKSETVWPAAFDAEKRGSPLELSDVDISVLPLERIGAPVGASGASVFIVYYAHSPTKPEIARRVVSHPLAVKIGSAEKLQLELDAVASWPSLEDSIRQRFAFPFHLDRANAANAVLVAPFRSRFSDDAASSRNSIQLGDLWKLLTDPTEILVGKIPNEKRAERCISGALDAMQHTHRDNLAELPTAVDTYANAYEWYLRGMCKAIPESRRTHIPAMLFGTEATLVAFGRTWPNPINVVENIVETKLTFTAKVGPIHGDLHAKNIVLDNQDQVQIIDFGWARRDAHIITDFLLLDINLRATTLPSQLSESNILALSNFLHPDQDCESLPDCVRSRARIIKDVVWKRVLDRINIDWLNDYLIPMLLVNYGLLAFLDEARNQSAMIASLLSLTKIVNESNFK